MNLIFVDTSALISLGNKRDRYHQEAINIFNSLILSKTFFITSNAVLFELGNTFSAVRYKSIALSIIEMINHSNSWDIITLDKLLMNRGIDKFRIMKDKDWSLVDCISMIIAEEMEITQIFTNDHHFTQAGFNILIQP